MLQTSKSKLKKQINRRKKHYEQKDGKHLRKHKKTQAYTGWLASYGISENDEFFMKWTNTLKTLSLSLSKLEKRFKSETMEKLWTLVYFFLYLHYDTEKEFMPQFLKNADLAIENIKNLEDKKGGDN